MRGEGEAIILSLSRSSNGERYNNRALEPARALRREKNDRPSIRPSGSFIFRGNARLSTIFHLASFQRFLPLSLSFSPAPHPSSLNAVCGKAAWRHTLTLIGYNSVYKRRLEMVGPSRRKQKETVRRRNIKLRTGGGWRSRAREREQGGRRKIKVYKVRPTTVP